MVAGTFSGYKMHVLIGVAMTADDIITFTVVSDHERTNTGITPLQGYKGFVLRICNHSSALTLLTVLFLINFARRSSL